MYSDQQQPVTQPSSDQGQDATDSGRQFAFSADWQPAGPVPQNNTAQTVHTTLRHLDQWREVLRLSIVRRRLLDDLDASVITNYFHYMPVADEQQIQSRQRNNGRTAGVEIFLDVLGRLGNPAWPEDLCEGLREIGQRHLSDLLEQEHARIVQRTVGGKAPAHETLKADIKSVKKMQYKPSIPREELNAMLQYCDLWKTTVRREKPLLRENVDAVEINAYFPYMSNKVGEKVRATADTRGRIIAMDVFIDDGLMYVGGQNWPNDLCFALGEKFNQGYIAEALKSRFLELLDKGRTTRYRDLDKYLKSSGGALGPDFGEFHSCGMPT
ncbi:uncharacterized protein [Amphiura filiformis]|uniref:uncharacterized protein n=1 Tax=Amphiura filiformis TaxID=82378 RepID=UPI003B20ECDC